eukprot:2356382-Pyramimonas_sp.AAC.1
MKWCTTWPIRTSIAPGVQPPRSSRAVTARWSRQPRSRCGTARPAVKSNRTPQHTKSCVA